MATRTPESNSVREELSDTSAAQPGALFRMKSAMVLFALEQSLGKYVSECVTSTDEIPEAMATNILARRPDGTDKGTRSSSVKSIVEESYIGELIELALKTSQFRHDRKHLERLKKLVDSLDLFNMRNAVCHANRPFPEFYWHCAAAIATDVSVDSLHFQEVINAFRAAEQDRLSPPPEDWLRQRSWSLPNTLPTSFDHEITGLIARQKESSILLKYLKNPRFSLVAVTGPGGSGKTALCLEVLRDCTLDHSTLDWVDQIVYITAKTEQLTASGIEYIKDPVDSLKELQISMSDALLSMNNVSEDLALEQIAETLGDVRVLLCVDNLETLLREHPNAFDEFLCELPAAWRVLVTSRINVNSAMVLPLGAITQEGAKKLARDYLAKRGGQRLSEDTLNALVNTCDYNPLAIRLALDSYIAGTDLANALQQTKDHIIEFSYKNLLDALPPSATEVLECLFGVVDPQTRSDIGYLLGMSRDDVADAISRLIQTSLVTRHVESEVERHSLSSSVRDLLLRYPRNPGVRTRVHAQLRKQRQVVSTISKSLDPCAWDHIPHECANHLKAVAQEAFQALRKRPTTELLVAHHDKVTACIQREPDARLLHRVLGHLQYRLHDRYGALLSLSQACECVPFDASAALTLAELLQYEKRLEEAQTYSSRLIEESYDDPERSSFESAARVLTVHWVVTIWLGDHRQAQEAAMCWRDSDKLAPTLECIYATASRSWLERTNEIRAIENTLYEIAECFSYLFTHHGYIGFVVHEAFNAIQDMVVLTGKHQLSTNTCRIVCEFVDAHLHRICGTHRDLSLDDKSVLSKIDALRQLDCGSTINPLSSERWGDILRGSEDPALSEFGFRTATIYHVPDHIAGSGLKFVFARAADGAEYYVSTRVTNLSFKEFQQLQVGDRLSVRPSEEREEGKAWPAREAIKLP